MTHTQPLTNKHKKRISTTHIDYHLNEQQNNNLSLFFYWWWFLLSLLFVFKKQFLLKSSCVGFFLLFLSFLCLSFYVLRFVQVNKNKDDDKNAETIEEEPKNKKEIKEGEVINILNMNELNWAFTHTHEDDKQVAYHIMIGRSRRVFVIPIIQNNKKSSLYLSLSL